MDTTKFRVYALSDDNEPARTPLMNTDNCANAVQWAYRTLRRWVIKRGEHTVCVFYGETPHGSTGFGELS
jgi:hypothetical protein